MFTVEQAAMISVLKAVHLTMQNPRQRPDSKRQHSDADSEGVRQDGRHFIVPRPERWDVCRCRRARNERGCLLRQQARCQ